MRERERENVSRVNNSGFGSDLILVTKYRYKGGKHTNDMIIGVTAINNQQARRGKPYAKFTS